MAPRGLKCQDSSQKRLVPLISKLALRVRASEGVGTCRLLYTSVSRIIYLSLRHSVKKKSVIRKWISQNKKLDVDKQFAKLKKKKNPQNTRRELWRGEWIDKDKDAESYL